MKWFLIGFCYLSICIHTGCISPRIIESEFIHDRDGHTTLVQRFDNSDSTVFTIDYYTPNQIRSKCERVNGIQHGVCKWWYESGELYATGSYKNGLPCGIHYIYFESNSRIKEKVWHNSNGTFKKAKSWYENGTLKSLLNYENGVLVWRKFWDEDGNLSKKEWYDSTGEIIRTKKW